MAVTIGVQVSPQNGSMTNLRKAWMEAEALGADRIYVADHFFAQSASTENVEDGQVQSIVSGENFEATILQAAMAATTTRAEIGCIVHANSYRNPNLLADIARTIDHISGGRFILGIGSGYLKPDYDEYGYEYGTQKSRLMDLARDVPIIKARFGKLNPPPLRPIPLLIAGMGESIAMRIVAEHANIWNVYGPLEKIRHKIEVLKRICDEVGRDFNEIELTTYYFPLELKNKEDHPDNYLKLGIHHIICVSRGPDWSSEQLNELLTWRRNLS